MPRLPIVSGRELCRALAKVGYRIDHQTGSHIILRHEEPPYRRLTIPDHKEVARGTLRGFIQQAGLSVEALLDLL